MKRTRLTVGALTAALLVVAACGDDSDGGGIGPGAPSPGDAGAPGDAGDLATGAGDIDPCTLLEVSEIEAAFGDRGTVLDGEPDIGDQCSWLVGEDQTDMDTGSVHVFVQHIDPELGIGDAADVFADQQDLVTDAVAVDGVGDGAYYSEATSTLNVQVGDLIFYVQAVFLNPVDGIEEHLEDLAAKIIERL